MGQVTGSGTALATVELDERVVDLPPLSVDQDELAELREYSASIPTGTTIGKRWRRDLNAYVRPVVACLHFFDGAPVREVLPPLWVIGEYVACDEPGMVGIEWFRVELR